jgi:hypothetical protein
MANIDEAADLALNSDFDIYISGRGDLATVTGRAAFEQKLVVRLQENFTPIINELDKANVRDMLLLETKRVVDEMDMVDAVAAYDAQFSDEQPNTVDVTIVYDTGDELTFEVTE